MYGGTHRIKSSLLILVENLDLLAHRFLMDGLKHCLHEVGAHPHLHGRSHTRLDKVVVAALLHDRHRMLFLVFSNLSGNGHTLSIQIEQLRVNAVDLLAQMLEAFRVLFCVTQNERTEDNAEDFGSDLLVFVAPCLVGSAMAFYHQACELHIESLLRERAYELSFASHMAWVAYDGEIGDAAMKLNRDVPLRRIPVDAFAIETESPVN